QLHATFGLRPDAESEEVSDCGNIPLSEGI
ncbi:MAG: hypothetical protein ACI9UA_004809, partial [Pseudoalteromonas tetraodonis]